jgi:serine/threonine protein phosphatase PrpC
MSCTPLVEMTNQVRRQLCTDLADSYVHCQLVRFTYFYHFGTFVEIRNYILFLYYSGDSRSVLCRDGRVYFATQDHKPINPSEKERIQNAGGSVMIQR